MRSVRPVRDDEFVDVVLGAAVPVVVGCAAWSDAPTPLGSLLDRLAAAHDWLVVARLDIARAPRTASAYGVAGSPSVLLFAGGRLVATVAGVPADDEVVRALYLEVGMEVTQSWVNRAVDL